MSAVDSDTAMRLAAFAHIKRLIELRDVLTADDLAQGFQFGGVRIPLINPRRGIFRPTQMQYLLWIETVFPKAGGRVWYDDQREVHGQIFAGVDTSSSAGLFVLSMRSPGTASQARGPDSRHGISRRPLDSVATSLSQVRSGVDHSL